MTNKRSGKVVSREWSELKKKTKVYPYKVQTEITNRIDPRVVEKTCGGHFMRMPDLKGHNIWHFKDKADHENFLRLHPKAKDVTP